MRVFLNSKNAPSRASPAPAWPMNDSSPSTSPRESQSYAAGPTSGGLRFWKRRAYSCEPTAPRLKNTACLPNRRARS